MPKLSKKSPAKKRSGASKGTPVTKSEITNGEPTLPQVWLPVDLSSLQNDVGGNLHGSALPPALRTKGVTSIREDASAAATFGDSNATVMEDEMLTEEERVAQFWAIEESAEPKGWLDDEELDYNRHQMPQSSHFISSSPPPPPSHPPPPPPSHVLPVSSLPPLSADGIAGGDDEQQASTQQQLHRVDSRGLFSYTQSQVYNVKCIGELHSVSTDWLSSEDAIDLVKVVETAQHQGRIPWTAFGDCSRILMLSKYGIKIVDMKKQRVFSRHALHNIVSVVHYVNSSGLPMLAVRVTKGHQNKFDLFVYQCDSESQANEVCAMFKEAFDSVLTKLRWEEGMGAIGLH